MSEEQVHSVLDEALREKLRPMLSGATKSLAEIEPSIWDILQRYDADLLITQMSGHPKVQKQRLNKLAKSLEDALDAMIDLPPDYAVAVAALAVKEASDCQIDTDLLETDMARLAEGVRRFLRSFEPPKGRPTNTALEGAVRDLMRVFQEELSLPIAIKWNKPKGVGPEPESEAARAIVAIIRSVPKPPSRVSILNMIRKVSADPDGEAPSPFDPPMRALMLESDLRDWGVREERD